MKTIYRPACVKRSKPDDVTAWARDVVRQPAAHHATPAEARIVARLLEQLGAGR